MATKDKTTEALETTAVEETAKTDEKVEISQAELNKILSSYDEMKNQVNLLTKQLVANPEKPGSVAKAQQEAEMLAQVAKANATAIEEVEVYVDNGSLKSNKNLEVNVGGVQFNIPKGQTVKVPKYVSEVIDNARAQQDRANGLQEKRAEEAIQAEQKNRI